jgi:transposase-like protein
MDAKVLMERLSQERAGGRQVSEELQRLTLAFAEQRRSTGASWKAVGAELGVSHHTLHYWRHGHNKTKGQSKLARVEIVRESQSTEFVVHGPCELRVEHMTVVQLAELLKRLR